MTDINGKEIEVGQTVAFSSMTYGGTSHWINYGKVIEVKHGKIRDFCKIEIIKSGSYFKQKYGVDYNKIYTFYEDKNKIMNKKILIID